MCKLNRFRCTRAAYSIIFVVLACVQIRRIYAHILQQPDVDLKQADSCGGSNKLKKDSGAGAVQRGAVRRGAVHSGMRCTNAIVCSITMYCNVHNAHRHRMRGRWRRQQQCRCTSREGGQGGATHGRAYTKESTIHIHELRR